MADEALQSFTYLLENLPGWIVELEGILEAATGTQKELLTENQPADEPDQISRKLSKSSSLKSKRSRDERALVSPPVDSEAILVKEQAPHMTEADALRLAQRKRKTVSAASGRQSGPFKYRSSSMVVVYYDGDTQKRFETLVRSIGTCRNSLRKGKMSAKVEAIARTGSSSSSEGSSEEAAVKMRKMGCRSTRLQQGGLPKNDGTKAFDKADGFLEKAQTLCERAAHQILRDGDCVLEIRMAKEHFGNAEKACEAELPELRKKADKAAERRRRSEERRKIEAQEEEKTPEVEGFQTPEPSKETIVAADEDPFRSPATLELAIEADDSDGDNDDDYDAELALPAIELGKSRMRNARLAAAA